MRSETVQILCNPNNHEPLVYQEKKSGDGLECSLVGVRSGKRFPVYQDIPVFIDMQTTTEITRSDLKFYEVIAPVYDGLHKLQALSKGGEHVVRQKFLHKLGIKDNDKVLEVAVGTGANLRYLPPNAKYYGIDISWQMLSRCIKTKERYNIDLELILSDAGKMPFKKDTFDIVFSVCAFRLFSDQEGALKELLRVAKPGATIVIVDQQKVGAPLELLPAQATNIKTENIDDWKLYSLTFTKSKK